jgi:hypothetical protein
MPQRRGNRSRTPEEEAEFTLMLPAITDLYLTARVLILLDGSYASRFWTLMEAWCAMQQATSEGLRPATDSEARYSIVCIHNASDEFAKPNLIALLSRRTPDEMHKILGAPDVNVTNAKDKVTMLPVVQKTDSRVKEYLSKMAPMPLTHSRSARRTFSAKPTAEDELVDPVILPEPAPAPTLELLTPPDAVLDVELEGGGTNASSLVDSPLNVLTGFFSHSTRAVQNATARILQDSARAWGAAIQSSGPSSPT